MKVAKGKNFTLCQPKDQLPRNEQLRKNQLTQIRLVLLNSQSEQLYDYHSFIDNSMQSPSYYRFKRDLRKQINIQPFITNTTLDTLKLVESDHKKMIN